MQEFEQLRNALNSLSETVLNFPVGATSLDDLKPTDEKIRNTRKSLKNLNARLLLLKAKQELGTSDEETVVEAETTVAELHKAATNNLINNTAIQLCLHSVAAHSILDEEVDDPDLKKKIQAYMLQLYSLSDSMLPIQKEINEALIERTQLKIEYRNELLLFEDFVKEQKETRNRRLQETNPVLVKNKEKIIKKMTSINIIKTLISNFIAASNRTLSKHPFLLEMLEKHRDVLSIKTIFEISRSDTADESVGENNRTETE